MTDFSEQMRRLMAAAGVSLGELARRTHYTKSYLSKVMNGHRPAPRELAARLDAALEAGGQLAALVPAGNARDVPGLRSNGWAGQDTAALAALITEGAIRVDADNAVRIAHQWLVTDPPQLAEMRSGRRVGAGLVAKVEARVAELRRLDDYVGGGDLAETVERELAATVTLLAEAAYSETLGRRLLVAVGELAQIAGWVLSDAGMHEAAAARYLAGVRAAHAAGHAPLAANLLSSLSYQMANAGQPREAVLLARSAYRGAERVATPRTRALLLDRVAWAHTRAGDASEAERALDGADDEYAHVRPGDDDPDWVYWVDRDELDVLAGRCLTELRRPLKAEPLLRSVLARYDESRARETSLYLTWLAEGYLHANEIEQASVAAAHALDLSATVNSARVRSRVATVRQHMQPYQGSPTVREFDERLRSLETALAAPQGHNQPLWPHR
ncbi:MAG: helix-turn-helix domain-containing protein [Carbonactinosporaceae bacterium]